MERGPTAKHHPAWNPQCTQWFRAEEFPTPKVMPRFSLGDVGEARWPLSHRWTDTSPILPKAAHVSRNEGHVVSLSLLSLLSACVRLCQLRKVHHSLQQALNAWSRTQSAATDGSPACCIISDVTRVHHAQGTTLSILRVFIVCAAAVRRAVLVLFGPFCLGPYTGRCRGVLPRANARCVVGQ